MGLTKKQFKKIIQKGHYYDNPTCFQLEKGQYFDEDFVQKVINKHECELISGVLDNLIRKLQVNEKEGIKEYSYDDLRSYLIRLDVERIAARWFGKV